jgi:hypothetical protein
VEKYNKKKQVKPADSLTLIKSTDKFRYKHTTQVNFNLRLRSKFELVVYVKEKDLLYIDPSKPLVVPA